MSLDINRKVVVKNAYRITKTREKTALRLRVPGGHLAAKHLALIKDIADTYGDGTVHLTTRQGFEIPGIAFEQIPEINKKIEPLLRGLEQTIGVEISVAGEGYPAAGTRNISACIGSRVCPFANVDTTGLALRMERTVFPHDFHVKIAITGCPNDCIKAHLHDFGIIGLTEPQYENKRCINCEACVKTCRTRVTGALTLENGTIERQTSRCIGCGECTLVCPMGALTHSSTKFFRLLIMGRTGKKNPRLAATFMMWVAENVILQVIKNTYTFIDKYIDRRLVKEHVGYIVDRVGYGCFRQHVLNGVDLNPEAIIVSRLDFNGYTYTADYSPAGKR